MGLLGPRMINGIPRIYSTKWYYELGLRRSEAWSDEEENIDKNLQASYDSEAHRQSIKDQAITRVRHRDLLTRFTDMATSPGPDYGRSSP